MIARRKYLQKIPENQILQTVRILWVLFVLESAHCPVYRFRTSQNDTNITLAPEDTSNLLLQLIISMMEQKSQAFPDDNILKYIFHHVAMVQNLSTTVLL